MHYHAEIWIPPHVMNVNNYIAEVMRPYSEDASEHGFFDWYQIGGRYTGCHDPHYDPRNDKRNIEICDLCNGTGFRTDDLGRKQRLQNAYYTCNACGTIQNGKWIHGRYGAGKRLKWPTQWAPFNGDIMHVRNIQHALECYTLIIPTASNHCICSVLHIQEWDGAQYIDTGFNGLVKPELAKLQITDGKLATIDYHN